MLISVNATLDEVNDFAGFINDTQPQIAGLLEESQTAIVTSQDVLEGLSNSPFIRGGSLANSPSRRHFKGTVMRSSDRFRLAGIAVLLVLLVFTGCSSAPDEPESVVETKNRATRYTEFGNAHFSRGDYPLALRFFDLALQDNISGR
jgi:hypothetical protein